MSVSVILFHYNRKKTHLLDAVSLTFLRQSLSMTNLSGTSENDSEVY